MEQAISFWIASSWVLFMHIKLKSYYIYSTMWRWSPERWSQITVKKKICLAMLDIDNHDFESFKLK